MISRSADAIVAGTLQTTLIVVVAVVARYLLHRVIYRVVEGATGARVSRLVSRAPALGRDGGVIAAERSAQRARTIGSVLRSITSVVIGTVAAVMVLAEFNVNLAPILASAGIVGLAVGFGAQNLVRDFLSGMFMLLEDQYGVGDIVDVGVGVRRGGGGRPADHHAARRQRDRLVRAQRRDPAGGQQEPGLRDRRGRPAGGAQRRHRRGHRAARPGGRRAGGRARTSPTTCWSRRRCSAWSGWPPTR